MELGNSVEAAARRTFPPEEVNGVLRLLRQYGDEHWHREPERVRRAIIKLSEGDIGRLKHYLGVAQMDYRDVLWWADEPPDNDG